MKRSERIDRWFAVMHAVEKQIQQVDKIEHTSTSEIVKIKATLRKAVLMVDQILSCNYNT